MKCARFGCPDHAMCDGLCTHCWLTRHTPTPIRGRVTPALEDALWLRETGESFDGAARRMGIKPDSLERLMARHGVPWPRAAA